MNNLIKFYELFGSPFDDDDNNGVLRKGEFKISYPAPNNKFVLKDLHDMCLELEDIYINCEVEYMDSGYEITLKKSNVDLVHFRHLRRGSGVIYRIDTHTFKWPDILETVLRIKDYMNAYYLFIRAGISREVSPQHYTSLEKDTSILKPSDLMKIRGIASYEKIFYVKLYLSIDNKYRPTGF